MHQQEMTRILDINILLRSHGAHESMTPSLALLSIVSGSGSEWRTMAPYRPYSAMMLERPHVFSVLRHLARLFWNHTWYRQKKRQELYGGYHINYVEIEVNIGTVFI